MQSSAATFAIANETTTCVALHAEALCARPLLLRACPRCADQMATRLERLSLRAQPTWMLTAGLAAYVLATTLAARALDLVWYRSLLPRGLYTLLFDGALIAVLAVPFLFAASLGLVRLLRPRVRVRIAVCASCAQTTRRRALATTLGFTLVLLGSIAAAAAARGLGLAEDVSLVALVPTLLTGTAVYAWATRPGRISCVRADRHEVVLRVPTTVARVIERERPQMVRRLSDVRAAPRWLAPLLVGTSALALVVIADEAVLVCPMETVGLERTGADGRTHHYCVDDQGQPHGRYEVLASDGALLVLGGYDRGRPSGLWAERGPDTPPRFVEPLDVYSETGIPESRWTAASDGLPRPLWAPTHL